MASQDPIETFILAYRDGGLSEAIDSVAAKRAPARACSPVLRRVALALGVTPKQLLQGGRCPKLADARHIAAWVLLDVTGATYAAVGEALGGMHHTTIMYARRRVQGTPRLLAEATRIKAKFAP